ncbi:hypothetical protein F2Q69_00013242 [Brassica cretica]|uniref:Uncharacterized protein n=1 Tax=Brassica cretica TaxID=69181 RepID=A0A8S9QTR0_BRACR|nr:hypothetical protein F2Q69_00013242 [Brassica cretica]
MNILPSVDIHSGLEPKLTSNAKPDTTACLGAWYTWDRILQTSLEEVVILSFKSCESLLFSNLFQRDCPSVLLEDKQKCQSASCSRSYARFTKEWLVCLARGSCREEERMLTDAALLNSIDMDARMRAEHIL